MTVRERLERAETLLMLARCTCTNDGAQEFSTPRELRKALAFVLSETSDNVYWAREALSAKALNKDASDDDEKEQAAARQVCIGTTNRELVSQPVGASE